MNAVHRFTAIPMAVLAVLCATVAFMSTAEAEGEPSLGVTVEEQADGSLGLFVKPPPEAQLPLVTPPDVAVRVDGDPVLAEVVDQQGAIAADRALILVDSSGSMQGARLREVRQAIKDLLAALDPSLQVGLGTFAEDYRELVLPTTDRQALLEALATIRVSGDTALFGALLAAIRNSAADRIIVLTDGQDTASSVSADDVIQQVSLNTIPVYVIALEATGKPSDSLARIITASGGVSVTTPESLAESLRDSIARIDPQLQITTNRVWNSDLDGRLISVVLTDSSGRSFTATTTVDLADAPAVQVDAAKSSSLPAWVVYLLALGAFTTVLIVVITAVVLVRAYRRRRRTQRVLAHYSTSTTRPQPRARVKVGPNGESISRSLGPIPRKWAEGVRLQVEKAELPISPTAWILVQASIMVVVFGLLMLVGLPILVALLGFVLSAVLTQAIVRARIDASRRQFDSELADFFTLLASGLRSGLSLGQAVAGAAQGGSDVLARQMRRVTAEVALGMDLSDALEGVASRMSSEDLAFAVQAIRIQHESGGSLSNILDIAASTVRQRAQLQREVRALSAEGRISAIILMVLPAAIFAFFFLTRREYVEVFWSEPAGWVMLGGLVVILGVGAIWIQRMTKIEI